MLPRGARPFAEGLAEGPHDSAVEAGVRLEAGEGICQLKRRPSRCLVGQFVEAIGYRDDPRAQADVRTTEAAVVAGAIDPLLVVTEHFREWRQSWYPLEDALAVVGMQTVLLPFRVRKLSFPLFQGERRYRHEAEVVHQCSAANLDGSFRRATHVERQPLGHPRYP